MRNILCEVLKESVPPHLSSFFSIGLPPSGLENM
jgi:hypothetical protein